MMIDQNRARAPPTPMPLFRDQKRAPLVRARSALQQETPEAKVLAMLSVLSWTNAGDPSIAVDPDLGLVVLIIAVLLMFSAVRLLSPTLALAGELLRVVMKGAAAAVIVVVALALLVIVLGSYLPR